MLSNRSEIGLDLLDAMVNAAADKASSHLSGRIRFARCDAVQLNHGFAAGDIDLEAWSVSADRQAITITVLASAGHADGSSNFAGSGRFTFTTIDRSGAAASGGLF